MQDTMLYWEIGRRIRQDILEEERAAYGKEIVAALGRQLESEKGNSGINGTIVPSPNWKVGSYGFNFLIISWEFA